MNPTLRLLSGVAAALSIAAASAIYTAYQNELQVREQLTYMGKRLKNRLLDQALSVEHGLRGARGVVITAGASFNGEIFKNYMATRDLAHEFPAVQSFCFIRRVNVHDLPATVLRARTENPAFALRQFNLHNDAVYVLQYMEPALTFGHLMGWDLGSETQRRSTLDKAVETQAMQFTPPLGAIIDRQENTPDVVALLPVFLPGSTSAFGWVCAPLFVRDFLAQVPHDSGALAIDLNDEHQTFYSTRAQVTHDIHHWLFGAHKGDIISFKSGFEMGGRQWSLTAYPTPDFFHNLNQNSPPVVAVIAALIWSLFTALYLLQRRRQNEQIHLERNQQEQLGLLIDAAPCGMMFIDPHYRFVAVNKQLCALTGYSRIELIDESFDKIMGENQHGENLLAHTSDSGQRGQSGTINFEMMVRRKNGDLFPAAIGFSTLKQGQSINIVATLEDISARRKIAQQISESESKFRQLANAMPQHVWIANPEGELTFVNRRCADYFGLEPEAMKMDDWFSLAHKSDQIYFQHKWQNSVKSGVDFEIEIRLRRVDNQYCFHLSRAIAVTDEQGNILAWHGTNTDISESKNAQIEILEAARNTQAVIDSVMDGIIIIDQRGIIISFNHSAEHIFGYQEAEVIGRNASIVVPESHRTQYDSFIDNYFHSGEKKTIGVGSEFEGKHKDGHLFKIELRIAEIQHEGTSNFIALIRDITERHYNETLLAAQDHILSLIARNSLLPITLEALVKDIEALSPDLKASILLIDASGERLIHGAAPSLPAEYNAAINGVTIGEGVGSCGTAAYRREQVIVTDISKDPLWANFKDLAAAHNLAACWSTPIFSENTLLGTFALYFSQPRSPSDEHKRVIKMATHVASLAITHQQRGAQIRQLAFFDSLTSLPNRSLGMDRLVRAVNDAHRRSEKLAVIFIDLDSFKTINDSLGHHIGDKLLQQAAQRLQHCVRENDTVARLGGDEFFVILNGTSDSIADVVTKKILAAMDREFDVEGNLLHATCSIGVSLFPNDGLDANTLLRNADAAMYRAKAAGRNNVQYYTEEMNRTAVERITLEQEIRKGIERSEFVLFYQPRINNANGKIIGLEALIRWQHPSRGLVQPNVFIPVAEQSGLIVPLGDWVLETACAQLADWLKQGCTPLTMAVNLSPRQFNDNALSDKVQAVLMNSGLPANRLELEITESMVMDEGVDIIHTLTLLKAIGVSLAIDDFGTGYSNLSRLKHLPIDVIKIDKSFVDGIPDDLDDTAIASTIIAMAHHLKLKIVAEGVETYAQQKFLSDKYCDEMQGYLFGKPESAKVTAELIGVRTDD